ncbi:MAG: hypothetical protein AUH43_13195 [Acidobacteria bacterium 13_1_40CM_65_14]|nr:MAG: hypothetical protein AUH43_13195 [Acidobacteria bacterium 13_1_40CM_65_14]
MTKRARDIMTSDPACCSPTTTLDEVAKLMAYNDCGEIPVVDPADHIVGVVTDRDIVCRVVAEGKNPIAYTAESCMSGPVVTVQADAPLDEVVAAMEEHQIRRVLVAGAPRDVAELVREVSRDNVTTSPGDVSPADGHDARRSRRRSRS